jgi:hypothetical protein
MDTQDKLTIYQLIEKILKESGEIMSGNALLDYPGVKEKIRAMYQTRNPAVAEDYTTHISNLLGYMYRRGLIDRYRETRIGERAWYAYKYKDRSPKLSPPALSSHIKYTIKDEADKIILGFEDFEITIKRRTK